MTAPTFTWGVAESARLTATFIVLDGAHMPASGLDEDEIRACLDMAHANKIRRSVIAKRIGWSPNRLWKWAKDHGCNHSERGFPTDTGPLGWLTRATAARLTAGGRDHAFNHTPDRCAVVKPWLSKGNER